MPTYNDDDDEDFLSFPSKTSFSSLPSRYTRLQVEEVEHIFEAHTIQRMELLVLSTLGWRMSSVTPFSYIDYFFHKLGISNLLLRALLSRVSEIILGTMNGKHPECPIFPQTAINCSNLPPLKI
jgi:hypothetical protein